MTYWDFDNWLIEQASRMPCAMNKGGNSKAQEDISNQISKQQLAMQQQIFSTVNPTIQNIIAGGGLLPGQESALRAQTINQLPAQFNQLYGQIGRELTARGVTGGQMAGGGDIARQFGSLGAAEAGQAQQGEFDIASLKQQGLERALGLGSSNALGLGSQGIGANQTAQQAAKAADDASTGFWGSLFGALTAPFKIAATI